MSEDHTERDFEARDDLLPLREVSIRAAEMAAGIAGLEINERQQAHVTLLQKILDEEKGGVPPRRRTQEGRRAAYFAALIRLALTVCLFGGALLPLAGHGGLFPARQPGVSEKEAAALLDSIKQDDIVFTAFEYDAGYAAELEETGEVLLRTLDERSALRVVLSTLPSGPLMAERLARRVLPENEGKVLRMGYLPGSQAGLAALVHDPHTALLESAHGGSLSGESALTKVRAMDDLALVLLFVSDANAARTWMEQVLPNLGETPFVVVASEQTVPLLLPYRDARPFTLLYGSGAAPALETALGGKFAPAARHDARQVLLVISLAALVCGLVYGLLPAALRQQDKQESQQ